MSQSSGKILKRSLVVLVAVLGVLKFPSELNALPPSPTTCFAVTAIATVCSLGSCTTTYYVDDYWCSRRPATDTVPNPYYNNPADIDQNLVIDDHKDVLKTSDPCAWQFDNGDRLGTAYGGSNSGRPTHNGVDIQAEFADPVGVVRHGRITSVGWQNPNNHSEGCGYRIVVEHFNGDQSIYCHLKENSAKFAVNEYVRAGTVIGAANTTGNSSGNHLHLIYYQGGNPIEYWNVTGNQPSPTQLNGNC